MMTCKRTTMNLLYHTQFVPYLHCLNLWFITIKKPRITETSSEVDYGHAIFTGEENYLMELSLKSQEVTQKCVILK